MEKKGVDRKRKKCKTYTDRNGRVCTKCKKYKEYEHYFRQDNTKTKRSPTCKKCKYKYFLDKKENIYKARKKWTHNNIEKARGYALKYYYKNRSKFLKNNRKRRKENPEKFYARGVLYRAIGSKIIIKPKMCSECLKNGKVHAHHKNYLNPLDVVWLCPICHAKKHYKQSYL